MSGLSVQRFTGWILAKDHYSNMSAFTCNHFYGSVMIGYYANSILWYRKEKGKENLWFK